MSRKSVIQPVNTKPITNLTRNLDKERAIARQAWEDKKAQIEAKKNVK